MRIKVKMKLILKRRGKDYESRTRKTLKNTLSVMGGAVLRKNYRERAKSLIYSFLTEKAEQHYVITKMQRRY